MPHNNKKTSPAENKTPLRNCQAGEGQYYHIYKVNLFSGQLHAQFSRIQQQGRLKPNHFSHWDFHVRGLYRLEPLVSEVVQNGYSPWLSAEDPSNLNYSVTLWTYLTLLWTLFHRYSVIPTTMPLNIKKSSPCRLRPSQRTLCWLSILINSFQSFQWPDINILCWRTCLKINLHYHLHEVIFSCIILCHF